MGLLGLLGRGFGAVSETPPVPTPVEPLLLQVADAVTYQINLGSYSQGVSAVRHYQPRFKLEEMNALHVSVVPRSIAEKQLSRSLSQYDCVIDIGVQKRSGVEPGQLDDMAALVSEIADWLREEPLALMPDARLMGIPNEPVFAPEHLDDFRQFTSVLSATYRVWR